MTGDKWGAGPAQNFHRRTSRSEGAPSGVSIDRSDFRRLDPANAPQPFKTYPGTPRHPLPRSLTASDLPAVEVLSGKAARATGLDEDLLATILFLTAGVTRVATSQAGPAWFRSSMSAGNLHPIEIYVVNDGCVAHYDPLEHALTPLRSCPSKGTSLILTGIAFRTSWKYAERGWRHVWWDAGTMIANLLAATAAYGIQADIELGFADRDIRALVGADGIDETPLAVIRLDGAQPPEGRPASTDFPKAAPVAPDPVRFPLVVNAQSSATLGSSDVEEWRLAARQVGLPTAETIDPPSIGHDARIEDVILRRGSVRFFAPEAAPEPLLRWALPAACRAIPWDLGPGRTLLTHLVNVHDLAETERGSYRYSTVEGLVGGPCEHGVREESSRLCANQSLGGDSAFTAFHATDLDTVLTRLGGRGYQAAHLEAGIVAGRLALGADALGHGATGLTFLDRQVQLFFKSTAVPVLATAVGARVTPPAPRGTPGNPAHLNGYDMTMQRLLDDIGKRAERAGQRR